MKGGKAVVGKHPSSRAWIIVHILIPLVPYLLDGLIRYVTDDYHFTLNTLNASTLAMSFALISIFINQSILAHEPVIPNDEDKEDVASQANIFLVYAMCCISIFAILKFIVALKEFKNAKIDSVNESFVYVIYFLACLILIDSIRTQRSFKLRAKI